MSPPRIPGIIGSSQEERRPSGDAPPKRLRRLRVLDTPPPHHLQLQLLLKSSCGDSRIQPHEVNNSINDKCADPPPPPPEDWVVTGDRPPLWPLFVMS